MLKLILHSYQTQSIDTAVEAELVQFQLWRQMNPAQKQAFFCKVQRKLPQLILQQIKAEFGDISIKQLRKYYAQRRLGETWANLIEKCDYWGGFILQDPLWLARYLGKIFEDLAIPYYIDGSVASSLQGEVRYTEDLDVVVNIQPIQLQSLISRIATEFYISEVAVAESMAGHTSSFNIIHLETTEKADIFIMRDDAFSQSKMMRRQLHIPSGDENQEFYLCTPEDTILQKLVWFRMSKNQSQKQWRDILGVLKLQAQRLDSNYMIDWASQLGLAEELKMALH